MKLTIEVDLSPQEARDVMGLPDVKDLQDKWLAEVEGKIIEEADKYLPESLIKAWTSGATGNVESLSNLFAAFAKGTNKS